MACLVPSAFVPNEFKNMYFIVINVNEIIIMQPPILNAREETLPILI